MNKIILYYNPRSGRGAAARAAERLQHALRPRGIECAMVEAFSRDTTEALAGPLQWADALVVLGGDGTVHSVAESAIRAGTPIYHIPFGTENLFAREFGMNRRAETLSRALQQGKVRRVDLARCNGQSFLLMCSVGPDASVIHRLNKVRSGRITHLSYIRPVIAEAMDLMVAPISITVDGRKVVQSQFGMVIVGNCRQYALRSDPACDALMDDGALDVVFFPSASFIGLLGWMLRARLRRHRSRKSLSYTRGSEITIESPDRPLPVQADGEALNPGMTPITLTVEHQKLSVLVPHLER